MSGIIQPPKNFVVFDGQNLSDFGLHVSGAGTYGSPERDVDEEEIPGRNGSLIFDNGRYKNADITYKVSILCETEDEYTRKMQELRSFLSSRIGYKRLEDTYRDGEYRLATFVDGLEPDDEVMLRGSEFDLKFNCKPQRFLKTGEYKLTFTGSGSIYNSTYFNAKPLIRIYGTGDVSIGSYDIQINTNSTVDYIDIDSDIMDCYCKTVNCNDLVVLSGNEFPVLIPGKNNIEFSGNITKIEITPRWYVL